MTKTPRNGPRAALTAVAVLLIATAIAACGSSSTSGDSSKAPDYKAALSGAPAPLSKLYAQGDAVLDGGVDGFKSQLASLKGHPVIVNKWASWCGPCREEFPIFQKISAAYGKKIAFLGVDGQDARSSAETFLKEYPVPYPSFSDPNLDIAQEIGGVVTGFPQTAFIDASGKQVYLKQGPYTSEADFRADIKRYLLG